MVPWLPFLITLLPLSFVLILIPGTPVDRLLADGTGLPGLGEPGVHAAAVVGCKTQEVRHLAPVGVGRLGVGVQEVRASP